MVDIRPSDEQLCDRLSKFRWNSFLNWAVSEWCCSSVWTVDLMHVIIIYEAWASGPWRLTSRCLNFECTTCLMNERVRMGTHIVRTVAAVFLYLCFGKISNSSSNTGRRPDVLLRRPDGCKLEQFEVSWHRGRFGWKVLVVRTDDA